MRLHLYLSKIFLNRFCFWLVGLLSAVFIFEAGGTHSFWFINLNKMALALHVAFPFLIFLSTLTFIQKLYHSSQLQALQSCGFSPLAMIRGPFFVTALLATFELFYVVPMTHHVSSKFNFLQATTHKWSLSLEDEGFTIFRYMPDACHFWMFNEQGYLKKNILGESFSVHTNGFNYHKGWRWTPCQAPEMLSPSVLEFVPFPKEFVLKHPWLMSFKDILRAIQKGWLAPNIFRFQRDYWLSKILWSLSLVVLGFGLFIGEGTARRRIFMAVLGLIGCLVLYIAQEILYIINWPYSFLGKTFILWILPMLTGLVGYILLFEKRQI